MLIRYKYKHQIVYYLLMTTINKNEKLKKEDIKIDENLFFELNQDFVLSKEESKRFEKSLENIDVPSKTAEFFKSARILYEKLKNNDFTITLEELRNE